MTDICVRDICERSVHVQETCVTRLKDFHVSHVMTHSGVWQDSLARVISRAAHCNTLQHTATHDNKANHV